MTAPPKAIDLRFLVREPADVYHAKSIQHVTAHRLAEFRRCPLLYRKREMGLVPDRDTTAYLIGRAAHVLTLEGRERFEREFAVGGPINERTGQPYGSRTKAFAEWAERQSRPVLADNHAALVEQMTAAVNTHTVASELLCEGVAEGVVRCRHRDHACQARIDWINPDPDLGIVEFKTADELDAFESAVRAFGYVYQLAFYRALVAEVTGHAVAAHIIAVEKREPFRCGVWRVAPHALDAAHGDNDVALCELHHCRAAGDWFTRFEELRVIDRL